MFNVCPCRGMEYLLSAQACSECGVRLDLPHAGPKTRAPRSDESWMLLARRGPWALRDLAERLQAEGITSRVDSIPPGAPIDGPAAEASRGTPGSAIQLGLYAPDGDLGAAGRSADESRAGALADGPQPESAEPAVCPACGEPLAAEAASGGSCGLEPPE